MRRLLLPIVLLIVCTASTVGATTYPPPSTETAVGTFFINCKFTHRAQVDPIVSPGAVSHHKHDFFGNPTVTADSTYASMTAAYPPPYGTGCTLKEDTAGYWIPTLLRSDGSVVPVAWSNVYYRNRPFRYGTTQPFPADLRMIAGGSNAGFSHPVTWWNCEGQSDENLATRQTQIPDCGPTGMVEAHVYFPNCWDGVHTDSPDHRSHMAYARDPVTGAVTNLSNTAVCPASHPVKLPQLDFRVLYKGGNGPDYTFSDGTDLAHADFWNTWQQPALVHWTEACLQTGTACGQPRT